MKVLRQILSDKITQNLPDFKCAMLEYFSMNEAMIMLIMSERSKGIKKGTLFVKIFGCFGEVIIMCTFTAFSLSMFGGDFLTLVQSG
jgi:hypothetical protein